MTRRRSLDATVEALCGDLSRDPRAARDRAERALVVDRGAAADAAEQPRPGGRRAARGARRLRRLGQGGAQPRGAAGDRRARCSTLGDDETLLVQSGKPVGVFRTHAGRAARADRELAARPALGDLGRVPPARGARADDVRPDDGRAAGSTSARRGSSRARTRRSPPRARSTSARPTSPGGRS